MKLRDTNTKANDSQDFAASLKGPLFATASHHVLEQRIAFDGALAATAVEVADQPDAPAPDASQTTAETESVANESQALAEALTETVSPLEAQSEGHAIVFIDSAVRDPALIADAVPEGAEVVVLDGARDGLAQIADYLEGRSGVESIHIVSHGEAGELRLGSTTVTTDSIQGRHADELAIVSAALTDSADILIYGCNFADDLSAVNALADATGADIAASDDDTGHADLGGNWDLETTTGAIEAQTITVDEWHGLLAPMTISVSGNPIVSGNGSAGTTALWLNAGTLDGQPIDMRATVLSVGGGNLPFFGTSGDDAFFQLTGLGNASVRWEIFESGTNQTVFAFGNPNFSVADVDGIGGNPFTRETVSPSLSGLTGYTTETNTNIQVFVQNGLVEASGTQDQNGQLNSLVSFSWNNVASWDITYRMDLNQAGFQARFIHDGDGDFVFVNPNSTKFLTLDNDGNDSTAAGTAYNGTFTEGGAAVPVVDTDVSINQHVALGANLGSATVELTNAQAGDILAVGTLPAGITANVDTSVAGKITVTLTGDASVADYETALKAITIENTSNDPDTADRNIDVSVTNSTFGTTSDIATSTISVTPVNDAPAGADNTIPATEDTPHSFTAAEFGFTDIDGDSLNSVFITTLPNVADGVLTLNGTPVTAGDEIAAAQITNLVFTPASNVNGNGVGSFTFQVKDDGGKANGGQDTDQSPNTINFNIAPVNDAPTAVDDTGSTDEDTAISINATNGLIDTNDTDPENDTLNVSKVNGAAGDVGNQITLPSGALLTVNADGSYDYDPNGQFENLAAGENGTDSFTYEISDGNGGTDTATVNLTINGVNDAPDAVNDTGATDEDTAISITAASGLIDTNDTDPDGSDTLTVSQVNGAPGDVGNQITLPSGALLTVNADGSYDYDPNGAFENLAVGQMGTDSFTYEISDGNGGTDTATVNLTITGVNDAPIADDESVITDEDVPVTIDVLDGDTDVDGTIDPASIGIEDPANPGTFVTSLTEAGVGTWTVDTDPLSPTHGQITFTPVLHYNGPVTSITYQVADNDGATTTATVDVALDGVNDAPSANPESFTINEDAGLAANVLSNDSDVDGHPLTVASATVDLDGDGNQDNLIIGGPAVTLTNGTGNPIGDITLQANGTVIFNPAQDYDGPVPQVTYTIDDGNGGTATTTLDITITPINDPPVLDLDADDSSLATGADFDNTFTEDGGPVAAIDSDVSIADPDDTAMAQAVIAVGGLADGADEILTIGGTSFALNIAHLGTVTVGGTTFAIAYSSVTGNIGISNAAGGDMPIADLEALLASVTYENTSQNPTSGDRTLDVHVNDGDVDSNIAISTITVVPVNDAPTAVDDTGSTDEDTTISITKTNGLIDTNDTDPENDTLNVSAVNGAAGDVGNQITLPSGALLTVNADGSYDYDPNGAFENLAVGQNGTDSFIYEISDGNGGTDTATVNLTINGVNDAPDAVDDSNTTDEDTAISIAAGAGGLLDNDTDPDATDSTSIDEINGAAYTPGNQISLPSGALLTVNADGSYDYDPNGQFESLAVGSTATDTFTYTIDDGNGGTDTATVNLTITGVNDAPTAVDDTDVVPEDGPTATGNVITGTGTDTDPDSDPLTVTAATQGANALTIGAPFTTAGGGVLTLNSDGSYSFDPGTSYNGLDVGETATETITYTVDDGNGGTDTATLTITIDGANDAPVPVDPANPGPDPTNPIPGNPLTVIPTQPVTDGQDFTVTPLVDTSTAFVDPDGEPLTFTTANPLPTGLTLNPNGTITGTVDKDASQGGPGSDGLYPITVTATDPDGATSTITFTIDVSNPPPVAIDDTAAIRQGAPISIAVLDNDHDTAPDSDPLTVIAATSPQGSVQINPDGSLTFSPSPSFVGTAIITYTISDGNGGTDTAIATITVAPADQNPRAPTPDIFAQIPTDPSNPTGGISVDGAIIAAVNGTLGGNGSLFGPAVSIGGADLTTDPVLTALNHFRSLNGMSSLARLYSLDGTASFVQADGPIGTVVGHLAASGGSTDEGLNNHGGLWGPDTLTGFSIKYGEVGGAEEVVTIESVVNNRTLILNARPSEGVSGLTIENVDLRMIDGSDLPGWLEHLGQGVFMGERPADAEQLDLEVTVTLEDGTSLTREITIQTPTGEISQYMPERRSDVVPLFNDQLQARHELTRSDVNALAMALAG